MGKVASLVASFAIFVLVAVVGYSKMGGKSESVSPRANIDKGIQQVKQTAQLKPAEEQLLRVQLAVNDYLVRNAMPPPSLAALVPTYFETVPVNPDTNQPFEYSKTGATYRLGSPGDTKVAHSGGDKSQGAASGEGKVNVSARTKAGAVDFINPNLIEPETFVYDATTKRDPFQPWDLQQKNQLDPNKSPLEQYDIKQLRLTAVLGDNDGGRTALVEDSFGKGYTVKIGTRIGSAGGVAAAIEPDLIKVIETKVDFNGVEKQEVVELKIQASSMTAADKQSSRKGKLSSLGMDNSYNARKKRGK